MGTILTSLENTFYCGWKDREGNVHDLEEIKARTTMSAKYDYIRKILVSKYPKLANYRASSLISLIYTGTSSSPQRGRPAKPALPSSDSFYEAIALEKEVGGL